MVQIAYSRLPVWKKAHSVGVKVYRATQFFPKDKGTDLVSDLRAGAQNIAFNIERGFTEKDIHQYAACFKESYEATVSVRRVLSVSRCMGFIGDNLYQSIEKEIEEIIALISRHLSLINHLESSLNADVAYNYSYLRW